MERVIKSTVLEGLKNSSSVTLCTKKRKKIEDCPNNMMHKNNRKDKKKA